MHVTREIYEDRMNPVVRTVIAPTQAAIRAQKRPPLMGNMSPESAYIDAYEIENRIIMNGLIKQGIPLDYVEMLQIYVHAKSYYTCDTHDPAPNVPSLYIFNENKADTMSHYHLGKKINNAHGYHSVRFDEEGVVKDVFYLDDNDKLQNLDMNIADEKLQDLVTHVQSMTAPTYQEAVAKIISAVPDLAKRIVL
jgi:hypothetical protein